jgi:hypothetical protein
VPLDTEGSFDITPTRGNDPEYRENAGLFEAAARDQLRKIFPRLNFRIY